MKVEIKPAISSKITVAVVAPGAGTGINGAIYSELGRNPSFKVEVVGRSRAPYDVYPLLGREIPIDYQLWHNHGSNCINNCNHKNNSNCPLPTAYQTQLAPLDDNK
ncbi:unnamed protein product [Symbiodinium sp. CCMP2592]|nr:unnamed protein product [Symbiodinium sp. CCMP2592]